MLSVSSIWHPEVSPSVQTRTFHIVAQVWVMLVVGHCCYSTRGKKCKCKVEIWISYMFKKQICGLWQSHIKIFTPFTDFFCYVFFFFVKPLQDYKKVVLFNGDTEVWKSVFKWWGNILRAKKAVQRNLVLPQN